MSGQNVDRFALLLSTDWFVDRWWVIGLHAAKEEKLKLQFELRKLVRQFMHASETYWLADFSTDRTSQTKETLLDALNRIDVNDDFRLRVAELLQETGTEKTEQTWIFYWLC
jgi:hypothetical protein